MERVRQITDHGRFLQPMSSRRSAPPIPREHGAWVMLCTPLLIVLMAMPPSNPLSSLLLIVAATSAFCLQHVAGLIIRRRSLDRNGVWLAGYLSLLLASGLSLLFVYQFRGLLLIALLAAGMFGVKVLLLLSHSHRRFDRTLWGEVFGVLALTLTGPAASVVARGALDGTAWRLWAGLALYFTSGVFYVNLLLAASRSKAPLDTRARWRLGSGHVSYHVLLAALVGYASAAMPQQSALLLVLAYAPILVRAFSGWIDLSNQPPSLQRVGLRELLYTVWFAGCWVAWLRMT